MKHILLVIGFLSAFFSCAESLEVDDSFIGKKFELISQDSLQFNFPEIIKGKIGVVGYVFTNCPDICPLTTNNMRLIQERLKKEGITDVELVSISFDPEVDTPPVLKRYAELRRLDLSNWTFLTGKKSVTDALIKEANVLAIVGDSTIIEGETTYFYVHTDRISLFDRTGNIRNNYLGSQTDIDQVIKDVKKLLN